MRHGTHKNESWHTYVFLVEFLISHQPSKFDPKYIYIYFFEDSKLWFVENELYTISIGQTTHNQSKNCDFSKNLACGAVCSMILACGAVCCSVSQCVAVCRSVLQCVAVCCSVLQCDIHVCTFFVYLIGVNTRMRVYEATLRLVGSLNYSSLLQKSPVKRTTFCKRWSTHNSQMYISHKELCTSDNFSISNL